MTNARPQAIREIPVHAARRQRYPLQPNGLAWCLSSGITLNDLYHYALFDRTPELRCRLGLEQYSTHLEGRVGGHVGGCPIRCAPELAKYAHVLRACDSDSLLQSVSSYAELADYLKTQQTLSGHRKAEFVLHGLWGAINPRRR